MRFTEVARKVLHKTEVGLPRWSEAERESIVQERESTVKQGRQFVAEVKRDIPMAGVDESLFRTWSPKPNNFKKPKKLGTNPHAYHNQRHTATVLAVEMFLVPYVEDVYRGNLPRPLLSNAVYAGAAGHDLLRRFDVLGAVPKAWYKLHGEKMAQEVRLGKYFPNLTPKEREVAANSIAYHDVDPRGPHEHSPEDELLAIVDRAELVRLIYGEGFWPKVGRAVGHVRRNPFESQRTRYRPHYFSDLAEKIQPLSKAMLFLGLEGMRKGLSQEDAVVFAMQQLGMLKESSTDKESVF